MYKQTVDLDIILMVEMFSKSSDVAYSLLKQGCPTGDTPVASVLHNNMFPSPKIVINDFFLLKQEVDFVGAGG
jgi:hypothetical protein